MSGSLKHFRLNSLTRRFAQAARAARANCEASVALEFAFVALPFLALLAAILETGVVFFAQQVLETATTQAARLVMTGQAQTDSMTASQFQQAVCSDAGLLFNCSGLHVNVQTFDTFSSVTRLNPVKNGKFDSSGMNFALGTPGDIVLVQTFYQWPVFFQELVPQLANVNNGYRLLIGTAVFRNEPY